MLRPLLAASLLAALAAGAPARAADQPIQLALFDPVQLVPDTQSVSGLRLTLVYSRNVDVTGFDYSFIATHTTRNFKGVQIAPVNIVGNDLRGLQWGWVGLVGEVDGLFQFRDHRMAISHGRQDGAHGGEFLVGFADRADCVGTRVHDGAGAKRVHDSSGQDRKFAMGEKRE